MEDKEPKEFGFSLESKVDPISGYTYFVYTKVEDNYAYTIVNNFEGPHPITIHRGSIIPHVRNYALGEQIFKGKVGNGELKLLLKQLM